MSHDLDRAVRLSDVPDSQRHIAKARFLVTLESLRPITPEEFAERLRAAGVECKVEAVQ